MELMVAGVVDEAALHEDGDGHDPDNAGPAVNSHGVQRVVHPRRQPAAN